MKKEFDVIVVGAGHAGCEAALASARLGHNTIIFATNLDTVAFCACNPSIGGTAKGQIVREIDALGGEMAINADKSILQMRMLNRGKGPAVYSPRAQVDKFVYHSTMKATLETTPNLVLRQAEVVSLEKTETGFVVNTSVDVKYCAKAVVLACGVYLNSRTIVGKCIEESGPNGFKSAKKLTDSLVALGMEPLRFKTGTPARVLASSVDFSKMEKQDGESSTCHFSYMNKGIPAQKRSCYLTYTTLETKQIVLSNLDKAPMYSGEIVGVGPRYCPSLETKIERFSDKERHQLFLEPEGECTQEFYVQGASTSLPADIQEEMYKSIAGLENVQIMRDAYAIEYDCFDATSLKNTLESKKIDGLFLAGQINGTSGYEEAAAQGLVAGINAVKFIENKQPLILTRQDSYIGVLIDDITTKQSTEPYRMMTSRAEHRLVLRQDNADLRLTQIGRDIGLVSDERYNLYLEKVEQIEKAKQCLNEVLSPKTVAEMFTSVGETLPKSGISVKDCLKRTNVNVKVLQQHLGLFEGFSDDVLEQIEINAKYEGYIAKQQALILDAEKMENKKLPNDLDYETVSGLRLEARQKLNYFKPSSLGQAGRISGVSPADVQILMVWLAQHRNNG
ncbi:MAG: tRNA uridine-5-carboxymethylaminomethyl(34) synthesis enzyme MnmG [Clostridia bacterium]|nr:tRNA uridine-5-carboxymethylaminomethyl(34) synthesis enzyme MnmG [Clostridia bacterium]